MEVKFIVKSLRTRTPFAVIFIIQIDRILAKDGIRAGVIMKFTLFSLGQPELFFFCFFPAGLVLPLSWLLSREVKMPFKQNNAI